MGMGKRVVWWKYEEGDQMQCQECLVCMDEHYEEEQKEMYDWGDVTCYWCSMGYGVLDRKMW